MSWFSKKHTDEIAKERLRLILVQDRFHLSSSTLNQLKEDILKVLSKYVEVGESDISIDIRRETHKTILEAIVPVKGVKKS